MVCVIVVVAVVRLSAPPFCLRCSIRVCGSERSGLETSEREDRGGTRSDTVSIVEVVVLVLFADPNGLPSLWLV